jgi:hypothetical protein
MIPLSCSARQLVILVVSLMVATSATMVSADKAKDAFDRIGFMQLKGEVDKAKATPRLAIDGSDTAANQLTPGTILVYRTSDGNYGKLQVTEYGYNFIIRWQTYKPNGQKQRGADRMLVKGTWTYDLDFGTEGKHPKSAAPWRPVSGEVVLRIRLSAHSLSSGSPPRSAGMYGMIPFS